MPGLRALTSNFTNYRATYSHNSDGILYLSRDRGTHSHPQVYYFHFAKSSEKRLTYQDGEIYDAIYSERGDSIYYSSTTDEIKERPDFQFLKQPLNTASKKSLPLLPPTEIYESHLDGLHIRRLTDSPQFDGQLSLRSHSPDLQFISLRKGGPTPYRYNILTKATSPISANLKNVIEIQYSPDGKQVLWVQLDAEKKFDQTEIWIADASLKNARLLVTGEGQNIDAVWHPQAKEILFASNREGLKEKQVDALDLYSVSIEKGCLKRLTSSPGADRWPQFSPDGRKLLFTSARNKNFQIFESDFVDNDCAAKTKPATAKL